MADQKLDHAREFTDIEDGTLDAWLAAEMAGLDQRAATVLDAGLMWEHYTSLLDSNPDNRAQHEIVQAAQLATKFNDEIRLLTNELKALGWHRALRAAVRLGIEPA